MLHGWAGRPQHHLAWPPTLFPSASSALSTPALTQACLRVCRNPTALRLPGPRAQERADGHTQIAVHNLAVVHLPPHGTDLLQLVFLGFHSFFQFLKLFIFRNRLLLMALLLL